MSLSYSSMPYYVWCVTPFLYYNWHYRLALLCLQGRRAMFGLMCVLGITSLVRSSVRLVLFATLCSHYTWCSVAISIWMCADRTCIGRLVVGDILFGESVLIGGGGISAACLPGYYCYWCYYGPINNSGGIVAVGVVSCGLCAYWLSVLCGFLLIWVNWLIDFSIFVVLS